MNNEEFETEEILLLCPLHKSLCQEKKCRWYVPCLKDCCIPILVRELFEEQKKKRY